jgi:hypothetical protein
MVSTTRIDAFSQSGLPSCTAVPISNVAVTPVPSSSPLIGGSWTSAAEIAYVMYTRSSSPSSTANVIPHADITTTAMSRIRREYQGEWAKIAT